jgi:phage tail sheath gpL-like
MAISFNDIPNNIKVPGQYVEMDNTNATGGLATDAHVIMLIGQKTTAGTEAAEEVINVFSAEQASIYFGAGSQLHLLIKSVFDNQNTMKVQAIALDDAAGAGIAVDTITISGTADQNGTLHFLIAGEYVPVGVLKGETVTDIATRLVELITEEVDLPVTAANVAGVVTLTAKNGGTVGNDMPILINWYGAEAGQVIPASIVVVIANDTVGATDPDVSDAITVMPDKIINNIVCPYNDITNLGYIEDEMDRRWGPLIQLEGHAYTSKKGTASELLAQGELHNNEHLSFIDAGQVNPTPAYRKLAALVGVAAPSLEIDPARPLQTLEIKGVLADKSLTDRNFLEANSLLNGGIATTKISNDGNVLIERLITTYQTSPAGAPDISYLDANTLYTLSFLRQTLINRIRLKYPRHKLADNGTRIPEGQAMVTPSTIKGEIISLSIDWADLGLVENLQQFADDLIVERSTLDPNRIDAILPPDLVNQFRVFAASIKFIL